MRTHAHNTRARAACAAHTQFVDYSADNSDSAPPPEAASVPRGPSGGGVGGSGRTSKGGGPASANDDYHRMEDAEGGNGDDVESAPAQHGGVESGYIEFQSLSYAVEIPSDKGWRGKPTRRTLLTDVSGYAVPGTIVALMGPSGAGKSTLLDVLADKKTGGHVDAEVLLINGKQRDKFFSRFSGYVVVVVVVVAPIPAKHRVLELCLAM